MCRGLHIYVTCSTTLKYVVNMTRHNGCSCSLKILTGDQRLPHSDFFVTPDLQRFRKNVCNFFRYVVCNFFLVFFFKKIKFHAQTFRVFRPLAENSMLQDKARFHWNTNVSLLTAYLLSRSVDNNEVTLISLTRKARISPGFCHAWRGDLITACSWRPVPPARWAYVRSC